MKSKGIQESSFALVDFLWSACSCDENSEHEDLLMDSLTTLETLRGLLNSNFFISLLQSHQSQVDQWTRAGIDLLEEIKDLLFDWQSKGIIGTSLTADSESRKFFDDRFQRLQSHVEALEQVSKGGDVTPLTNITRLLAPEANEFWQQEFGANTYQVDFASFRLGLGKRFPNLSDRAWIQIKASLDSTNTGLVTVHHWGAFLDGFGPEISTALRQMEETLGEDYFGGFLSFEEANAILRLCGTGAFLVRFSSTQPCGLVICHKTEGRIVQTLITCRRRQFEMEGSVFASLDLLIGSRPGDFQFAAPSVRSVARARYFRGFLTLAETQELLQNEAQGTFLFRFSANEPGALVLGFKWQNTVNQYRVFAEPERGGYSLGKKIYRTIDDIVMQNATRLRVPLSTGDPGEMPAPSSSQTESYASIYDRYGGITEHIVVQESGESGAPEHYQSAHAIIWNGYASVDGLL